MICPYRALDIFFTAFHSGLILFSLVGWVFRATRRLHLVLASLIVSSWLVLALWYGFGYCPCTDWHWSIKRKLGEVGLPNSYVKYALDGLTGSDWNSAWIDGTVCSVGLASFVLSLWLNWRDYRSSSPSSS